MNIDRINLYRTAMLDDLEQLVSIKSVRDESSITAGSPFGRGIREAFDTLIKMANREGFDVRDHNGYAIDISYGEGEKEVAILNHIDVVPEGDETKWHTPPYKMVRKGDFVYGRGVTDNKGPLVASLYLLKILKQLAIPTKHKVRLIVGGAEETTWECVEHYFKHNPQPDYGFSPDGDFPIVNGEKGIFYLSFHGEFQGQSNDALCRVVKVESVRDITTNCHELHAYVEASDELVNKHFNDVACVSKDGCQHKVTFITKREKSRNPHKADNAAYEFAKYFKRVQGLDGRSTHLVDVLEGLFVDSCDGTKLGLAHVDDEMGGTSCCVSSVNMDSTSFTIDFDFRFPKGLRAEQVSERLNELAGNNNMSLSIQKLMPLSHVPKGSHLIETLATAYSSVTGEKAECFSKGAASYARALDNGVAFGTTFPGEVTNVHDANEQLNVSSLMIAIKIYLEVLKDI